MHTEETIDNFVELRAQGWTLGHIATELHVSKRTLVDWNREYAGDIQAFRGLELELLKEKVIASREEDLNRLTRFQKDVNDELANRTLKYIDTDKLFRLSTELRQEIQRMLPANDSHEESSHPATNGHPRGMVPATNGTPQR